MLTFCLACIKMNAGRTGGLLWYRGRNNYRKCGITIQRPFLPWTVSAREITMVCRLWM